MCDGRDELHGSPQTSLQRMLPSRRTCRRRPLPDSWRNGSQSRHFSRTGDGKPSQCCVIPCSGSSCVRFRTETFIYLVAFYLLATVSSFPLQWREVYSKSGRIFKLKPSLLVVSQANEQGECQVGDNVLGDYIDNDTKRDTTEGEVDAASLLLVTQQQLQMQQKQIDLLMKIIQQQRQPVQLSAVSDSPTAVAPLKAMLFIDGTWLYYSVHERNERDCPIIQRYGRGWQHKYSFNWTALPRILCNSLAEASTVTQRPVEITRISVFTSYKADTPKSSFRYRMFEEMRAANYDVHMMETVGKSEKCVDIQLAVEMLHYATVQNAYDIALLLTGDKDFLPAMIRTRQKGRQVGLISMKRGCNRALFETAGAKDFDVIWLEDHLDALITPKDQSEPDDGGAILSRFTLMKILVDFITASGFPRVSSRDIGRYLKFLRMAERPILDELKTHFGGLSQFLQVSGIFEVEQRSDKAFKEDPSDLAYWVSLKSNAQDELIQAAKTTKFSSAEKEFFNSYSLNILANKSAVYAHTLMLLESGAASRVVKVHMSLAPELGNKLQQRVAATSGINHDFSQCKLVDLKEMCRERGLAISGTKAVLTQRIEDYEAQQTEKLKELYENRARGHTVKDVDQTIDNHLKELVVEYVKARGGEASSRDVGRYLAANKSSQGRFSRISALEELKQEYGSLLNFVHRHNETLAKGHNNDGSYAFGIALREGVRVP